MGELNRLGYSFSVGGQYQVVRGKSHEIREDTLNRAVSHAYQLTPNGRWTEIRDLNGEVIIRFMKTE